MKGFDQSHHRVHSTRVIEFGRFPKPFFSNCEKHINRLITLTALS
jgi:hypothetical protein